MVLRRRADLPGIEVGRPPGRILRQCQHGSATLEKPQQRQHRQQHRAAEQIRHPPAEHRLQPQPVIHADAAMDPGDNQHRNLQRAQMRRADPERIQFLRIAFFGAERGQRDPGHEQMVHQQERDAQPQDQLHHLGRGPAKMPPLIERPQSQQVVRRQGDSTAARCRSCPARTTSAPPVPASIAAMEILPSE